MTSARCPSCSAAVPIGAPWCTLCFADLRQPQPVAAAAVAAPAPAAVPAPVVPAPAPAAPVAQQADPLDPATPVSVAAAPAPERKLGWPCTSCGETVSFDMTFCPDCGSSFLPSEREAVSFRLPLVGDITRLSKGEKLVIIFGGMALITTVFFLLAFLVGSIF